MIRFYVGFLCLLSLVNAKFEQYDGHSLYKVEVQSIEEAKALNYLEGFIDVDVWSHAIPSKPGSILVSKENKAKFKELLNGAGIKHKVEVQNIVEQLELEEQLLKAAAVQPFNETGALPLDRVYTVEEIDDYIDRLGEQYPNVVTVVNGGSSFQGRPLKYLRISTTNFQDNSKPVVYLQSLLHAREWITQSATLYAIEKLVIDVTESDLLNDIDWIILPTANPDGYAHSYTTSRYWRKNRSTGHSIGNVCIGVDLNRNFDVMWSEYSSSTACSDVHHGPSAFSEPETAVIEAIVQEHLHRLALFIDIHSFGSWMLYGYGDGSLPDNSLAIHAVGVRMAKAIDAVKKEINPDYTVGNSAVLLYEASGTASDYASYVGVPLAYTYEMPAYIPGTQGVDGFLVDPDFIEQAGYETWEGIKFGARFARDNYSP